MNLIIWSNLAKLFVDWVKSQGNSEPPAMESEIVLSVEDTVAKIKGPRHRWTMMVTLNILKYDQIWSIYGRSDRMTHAPIHHRLTEVDNDYDGQCEYNQKFILSPQKYFSLYFSKLSLCCTVICAGLIKICTQWPFSLFCI